MKKILILIAVACFALTTRAQMPTYGYQVLASHVSCAAATATNFNGIIDCRKQATVAIQCTGSNTVAGVVADGSGLLLQRSVDGLTYETAQQLITWTPNGTTAKTIVTNIATAGAGYIKVNATNTYTATTNIGDLTVTYAVKISSP